MPGNKERVVKAIQALTGEPAPFKVEEARWKFADALTTGDGIGYSQFNEVLLMLGYDRVTRAFFDELFDSDTIATIKSLEERVERFQKQAMLLYGNIKFAFGSLSQLSAERLGEVLEAVRPIPRDSFASRHHPLVDIETINPEDAFLLGYTVEDKLKERLDASPDNEVLKASLKKVPDIQEVGKRNHDTYLTYDHLDVYVATSMREEHEFFLVNRFVKKLQIHEEIADLKLRLFDPTQAYCKDRIDKGLVEALMLKRAACTIYHTQETDTLGKDSELAATLAQGKPVIAYVPELTNKEEFQGDAVQLLKTFYADDPDRGLRNLLKQYCRDLVWAVGEKGEQIRGWVSSGDPLVAEDVLGVLFDVAKKVYDKRAKVLSELHPLGLQVNLETGVANGVLVVRRVDTCAKLLRTIILREMEFSLEEDGETGFICLRESVSGCIYRVVTADQMLTNSFWNFYLRGD